MGRLRKSLIPSVRVLTGNQAEARGLAVYPDDRFLVSYPVSGPGWRK